MSTISASTTTTTAFGVTADTTGALVFQTGASPTTALTLSSGQVMTLPNDASISGLTVGKGGGAVSGNTAIGLSAMAATATGGSNTAVGAYALNANTSGTTNSALGLFALHGNTTGSNNTAIGEEALQANTTASNNTAVGYQAGYNNTIGQFNVLLGYQAGYRSAGVGSIGDASVYIGYQAGYANQGNNNIGIGNGALSANTTGTYNVGVGVGSGNAITTGSKNSILGAYTGNQDGLDIRTASNWIVLSDGDGNARLGARNDGWAYIGSYRASSYNRVSYPTGATASQGTCIFGVSAYPVGNNDSILVYSVNGGNPSAAGTALWISANNSTARSINAAGTINASGNDYAEYMVKSGDFVIAKGDVVGIDANGKLTNIFANAISFVVKSTNPSYVGGDTWFVEQPRDENHEFITSGSEYDAWVIAQEAARQTVDRIAFSGQVPVNVTGATAGQYIIPVNDNGAIKGEAVSNPTFEQYLIAVGKVIAIESDGRARIIVKVS